jgi:hypothetical protein
MFEVPVSSPLSFNLALNNQDLNQHPVVKNALRLREAKYKLFSKDIKYKFKFSRRLVQQPEKSLSPFDAEEDDNLNSALNSARFDVATTYVYL